MWRYLPNNYREGSRFILSIIFQEIHDVFSLRKFDSIKCMALSCLKQQSEISAIDVNVAHWGKASHYCVVSVHTTSCMRKQTVDLHPSGQRWCSCCSLHRWWWGRGGTGREEGRPWSGFCLGSLATRQCCSLRAEAGESLSSTSVQRQREKRWASLMWLGCLRSVNN